jgi:hypothetical protein
MPFTASHAAAVLPFLRTPLAPAALVIGSMSPDLPYFLPVTVDRDFSHSLPGAVTIDLAIGILAFVLWAVLLRAPALDYSPAWLRERMPRRPRWRVGGLAASAALLVAALVLGTLTHLLLDLVTHEGSLSSVWPWFGATLGPVKVDVWLHLAFSVIGAVILAVWARSWAARTARTVHVGIVGARERTTAWVGIAVSLVSLLAVSWFVGLSLGIEPTIKELLFLSVCVSIGGTGLLLAVLAAVWHLRARSHSRG